MISELIFKQGLCIIIKIRDDKYMTRLYTLSRTRVSSFRYRVQQHEDASYREGRNNLQ